MIRTIQILKSRAFFNITQAVPKSVAVTYSVGYVFNLYVATAVK